MMNRPALLLLFILFLFSCKPPVTENKNELTFQSYDTTSVEYSKHFSIHYADSFKIVHIYKDEFRQDTLSSFLLVPQQAVIPEKYKLYKTIGIPIKKIACLSSLYVAYLEKLNLLDKLCALDNSNYIYSKTTRSQLIKNQVQEVGSSNSINFEKLVELNPAVIFTYWEQGLSISDKLNELNIKPVLVIDHLETSPLGRAEWIKLMAALFNEEKKANDFFNELAASYNKLSRIKDSAKTSPTVLIGAKVSDTWYVPGGKSYMAQLINDAGGNYLWKQDTSTGSLALNFEAVLRQARQADLWLNVYQWKSLADVTHDDARYAYFDAYKNKKIINYNARVNESGGNDYWESGLLQPDLLLSDLIKIFHPELLPHHKLHYYRPLE